MGGSKAHKWDEGVRSVVQDGSAPQFLREFTTTGAPGLHNRSMEREYDTLILSDVHLGSEVSRADYALQLLQSTRFRRLILLGDMFNDLNFRRLKKEHWAFLSCIRKLSNPKRNVEVVWVEGNHDLGLSDLMSHLVGVPVYQQYAWEYRGERYLAIHGHQFDRFAVNNVLISRAGQALYLWIQKLDVGQKATSRFLDRLNTRWLRLSGKVASGVLAHAAEHRAQFVFCGHTHAAIAIERNGIRYYNAGSWVEAQCSYITIDERGAAIKRFIPGERIDISQLQDWDSADPTESDVEAPVLML